jgi:hypothetical protein
MSGAANIRWGDVSERIRGELDRVRDFLETARPEDVPALQGEVRALRSVIDWFERGALAERAILNPTNPHDRQD